MQRCENQLCIYWTDNSCLLDHIDLDIQGRCETCIYITFDEEMLRTERQKALMRLEDEEL